jgi:hypothetical protein
MATSNRPSVPGSSPESAVKPLRLKNGRPVDFNHDDPMQTQELLRSIDYSQVSHDPRLRDAWNAAQKGKLADLMQAKSVWMVSTDIDAVRAGFAMLDDTSKQSLTGPLRELLLANNQGSIDEAFSRQREQISASLPTHELAKMDTRDVASILHNDSFGAAAVKYVPEELQYATFNIPGGDIGQTISLEHIRRQASKSQADYEAWHRALVASHENRVAQKVVASRIANHHAATPSPVINKPAAESAKLASAKMTSTGSPTAASPSTPSPSSLSPGGLNASASASIHNESIAKIDIQSTLAGMAQQNQAPTINPQSGEPFDNNQPANPNSWASNSLDALQTSLDVAGIADPTPIVDLSNAGISLYRAVTEPHRAGEHLSNAFISGISAIPYVGDLAKVVKYGGKAVHAAKGGKAAGAAHAGASATAHAGTDAASAGANQGKGVFGSLLNSIGGGGSGVLGTIGNVVGSFIGGGGAGGSGGGAGAGGSSGGGGSLPPGGNPASPGGGDGRNNEGVSGLSRVGQAINNVANFAGPASIALYAFGSTIQKVSDWLKKVDSENRKILEENRNLATYNGQMAAAYMRLDADRMIRDIHRGEALAGPVSRLAKAQSSFEASKENLFTPFAKLSIDIQAGLTRVADAVIQVIDYVEPISEIIQWWYGKEQNEGARNAIEKAIWMSEERVKPKEKL